MEQIKVEVKNFLDERDWNSQTPADVSKSISIESAELLEKFQWKNHSLKEINDNQELRDEIISELADVFIYSAQMALILDCDIDKIVIEKLNKQRIKYPVEMVKGEYGSKKYLEIKKKHRQL